MGILAALIWICLGKGRNMWAGCKLWPLVIGSSFVLRIIDAAARFYNSHVYLPAALA
jgi:hypothetical protein